jgi:hypothetical protein
MDLRQLAQCLGGEVSGQQVKCPGPGHSGKDRSLAVRLSEASPDGFIAFSHAGDDWKVCRDYIRQRLGMLPWQPGHSEHRQAEVKKSERSEDDFLRIGLAFTLWNEAVNPRGTVAENYLKSRALQLPPELAGRVLRFHPRCPWRDEDAGRTLRLPCLLAAFTSITDGKVTGIHRIRLDRPKRLPKSERRRMLGVVQGAAVMFDTVRDGKLAIGEGIETCLAGRQLGLGPCWALGSVGAISFFPIIEGVRHLIVFAETGAASEQAIRLCGGRWRRAGRRVQVVRPAIGDDLNDVLMHEASEARQQRHTP